MKMEREDASIAILWGFWLIVLLVAAYYGFIHGAEYISKIIVAIIGGAGALVAAILTHALTALREHKLELQKQKQQNYAALIEKIGDYVRSPKAAEDQLTKAHLFSWVVGSENVIKQTTKYMHDPRTPERLEDLLKAMRQDISLSDTDATLGPVFTPIEAPGSMKPRGS